jgi:hypothetical protein
MIMRPHRRDICIFNASAGRSVDSGAARVIRPGHRRNARRRLRTWALLAVIGIMRFACAARIRWQYGILCIGLLLSAVGVTVPSGAVFLVGVAVALFILLPGSEATDRRLATLRAERRWHG